MNKLFEAKKKIPVIKKDAKNPFFKSGYATLSNIIEVVEPILAGQGLFITHSMNEGRLITALWDSETTGNQPLFISDFALPANTDIQKIGSAITYAKRYNITALLNLNIEDDDDGNATKPKDTPAQQIKPKVTAPEPITQDCKEFLDAIEHADTPEKLSTISTLIAGNKILTKNDKDFLRNVFKDKKEKVK